MKRFILILSIISILFLMGCNLNKNDHKDNIFENLESQIQEEVINNNENQEIINDDVASDKEFDERILPYSEYISNTNFISNIDDYSGFMDAVHFVSEAKLENVNDNYKMVLTISEPIFFEAEEVKAMYSKLESNNTAKLGEYTFYKDIELLKSSEDWSEPYQQLIDNSGRERLATDAKGNLCFLFANTVEESEYKIATLYVAGATEGFVQMNPVKDIEIELYSDDVIMILPTSQEYSEEKEGYELTVKDFYEKALNNQIENDSKASGFKYSLDNIGDSMGTYGEYVDAVDFENGKIIVKYKNGGV